MNIRKKASAESAKVKSTSKTEIDQFPIAGIGASAGGLEALEQFFAHMPKECGMGFVVIQHLDPNHVGIMPELLQRITPLKVYQATDGVTVRPNCVYVIPPNKSLSILNGALHLFEPTETRGLRLPVDIFFRSLADDRQDKSIGIVLSGMGSDGSLGVKAIKEKNGIVLVQDPASAKFDGMPRSATESVIADIVSPADELPGKLIDFLKYIPAIKAETIIDPKTKTNLEKIVILLREQTGHDFSLYKKNTLFRRIERRKGVHQIDKFQNYVRLCQENPKEVEILFKELLIGVTSFFRDPLVWEELKNKVLPELINESPYNLVLRAWIPGCSTGEEAYTLAMIFQETLDKLKTGKNITLQIFGTDLDHDAIDKARRGVYLSNIVNDVSPDRMARFFTVEPDGFKVKTLIREMVIFAPQNVIKDPPFTKLDFLSCRNMLIYMEPELQKKMTALFYYSLKPGGIMLLGTAETLGFQNTGFKALDNKLKLFKRDTIFPGPELSLFPSSFSHGKSSISEKLKTPQATENIQSLADQVLLQTYAPASVLVNDQGDIMYMTGRIGKYLEPVAGKANYNIFVMAREGLRNDLTGAFRKALQSFDPVLMRNARVGTNGGTKYVDVTFQCLAKPETLKGLVMIVFTDVPVPVENEKDELKKRTRKSTGRLEVLELELQRKNEDLQGTREEMQTSQEELKSTNEELQSTNEELQSTNEELTTSKEEMQSLNEELQTVNIELQSKVADLLRATDDMSNLLNNTGIATLFLDRELNIRRFTDSVTKIFKLRPGDVGRPFTDQVSELLYPQIGTHCKEVLKTLMSVETPIATNDGRWFNVRILPYRTLDDHIDGLVLTFVEITTTKHAEDMLAISETSFRRLFESAKDGILILDAATGKIKNVNPFLVELLGYSKEQFLEKAIWEIGFFKDIIANKAKFLELQQKELVRYENLPLETAKGSRINVEFVSNVYLVANVKVIQCFVREISKHIDKKEHHGTNNKVK